MSIETRIEQLTAAINTLTEAITKMGTVPTATVELVANPTPAVEKPKGEKKVEEKKVVPAATGDTTSAASVEKTSTASAAQAAVVDTPAPVPEEMKATPAANPTYDDVKTAFLNLNKAKGRDATIAALAKCGAQTVPELQAKPEKFAEAIAVATQAAA